MRVYLPIALEGRELCLPADPEQYAAFHEAFRAGPSPLSWTFPTMEIVTSNRGKTLLPSEAPWFSSYALVLRERAKDVLVQADKGASECLPFEASGQRLFLYNATQVVDTLDSALTEFVRFSHGGIMRIRRHAFDADLLLKAPAVFKLPQLRMSPIYFQQSMVDAWRRSELSAFEFREVSHVQ